MYSVEMIEQKEGKINKIKRNLRDSLIVVKYHTKHSRNRVFHPFIQISSHYIQGVSVYSVAKLYQITFYSQATAWNWEERTAENYRQGSKN
jgi:hypothetical protein